MPGEESKIKMIRRHVAQGLVLVARQHELIERLRSQGIPTDQAEALLAELQRSQDAHEAHLAEAEKDESAP